LIASSVAELAGPVHIPEHVDPRRRSARSRCGGRTEGLSKGDEGAAIVSFGGPGRTLIGTTTRFFLQDRGRNGSATPDTWRRQPTDGLRRPKRRPPAGSAWSPMGPPISAQAASRAKRAVGGRPGSSRESGTPSVARIVSVMSSTVAPVTSAPARPRPVDEPRAVRADARGEQDPCPPCLTFRPPVAALNPWSETRS
jgi:hypothetical protein